MQSQLGVAAMMAIAAIPLWLLASVVARPLVLPTLCLVAIAGAIAMSFIAWRRGVDGDAPNVTAWDVAGALAFVACASAIFSNPRHVIALTM